MIEKSSLKNKKIYTLWIFLGSYCLSLLLSFNFILKDHRDHLFEVPAIYDALSIIYYSVLFSIPIFLLFLLIAFPTLLSLIMIRHSSDYSKVLLINGISSLLIVLFGIVLLISMNIGFSSYRLYKNEEVLRLKSVVIEVERSETGIRLHRAVINVNLSSDIKVEKVIIPGGTRLCMKDSRGEKVCIHEFTGGSTSELTVGSNSIPVNLDRAELKDVSLQKDNLHIDELSVELVGSDGILVIYEPDEIDFMFVD